MGQTLTVFITGTGTDVGKTFITGGLAALSVSAGLRTAVAKPVQTGAADGASDLDTIAAMCPGLMDIPRALLSPYVFGYPASPHLAASMEGRKIDPELIVSSLERIKSSFSPDILLVEGAGGVMVPLTESFLTVDLMAALGAPALIVSPAGLGAVNHCLLTASALKSRGVPAAGFILNMASKSKDLIEDDNAAVIPKLSGLDVLARVERISGASQMPPEKLGAALKPLLMSQKLVAAIGGGAF
jgi:dethiobiotin synthetase